MTFVYIWLISSEIALRQQDSQDLTVNIGSSNGLVPIRQQVIASEPISIKFYVSLYAWHH